jgi:hypothetical protein
MCSVCVCCWHVIPKFAYLANEKGIKVVFAKSVGFVMNEPSDSMNEGAELDFFPQNVI